MSSNAIENSQLEVAGDVDVKDHKGLKGNEHTSGGTAKDDPGDIGKKLASNSEDSMKEDESESETVSFKVVFNKKKLEVSFELEKDVASLKEHLESLTGVPVSMQKLMFRGLLKNESTLRECQLTKGAKLMLVGSTVTDLLKVTAPDPKVLKEEEKKEAAASKEALSKQKPHKTVLDKYGKPDDVPPGIKNSKESLPQVPLSGMYNKAGGKVRLTFKLELDQLWIGTKERTEKVPMGSIKAVVSEAIEGNEDYHIMGIQLGPTEASRYWVYWVPAQYVDAIKNCVLGDFQYF